MSWFHCLSHFFFLLLNIIPNFFLTRFILCTLQSCFTVKTYTCNYILHLLHPTTTTIHQSYPTNYCITLLPTPSNISYKGHVKPSPQADLSKGEKVQDSFILRGCVVDELQSAKEVYHCTNNLEKRRRR